MKNDVTCFTEPDDKISAEIVEIGVRLGIEDERSGLRNLSIYLTKSQALRLWNLLGNLELRKKGGDKSA